MFDYVGACNGNAAAYARHGATLAPWGGFGRADIMGNGPVRWDIFGRDPYGAMGQVAPTPVAPAEVSTWQKVKDWGNRTAVDGIPNWALATGVGATGLIWYGYYAGWFGGRGRDYDGYDVDY